MTRRVVRVTAEFFVLLDAQLPDERGPNGEPTAAEFAAGDLMDLVEEFAVGWDDLAAPIRGRTDYRILITTTHLVPYAAVYGQLSPVDEAIELIDIDIDLGHRHRSRWPMARRRGLRSGPERQAPPRGEGLAARHGGAGWVSRAARRAACAALSSRL